MSEGQPGSHIHENVIDTFERDVLDSVVPNDLWYKIYDRNDNVGVGLQPEHTSGTPGIELVTSRFLTEERSNRPRKPNHRWCYTSEGDGAGF